MKVLIAGASIGGLLCAYKLGKSGHEVIVFDQKELDELGYDWYDYVWNDFFEKLDIEDFNLDYFIKKNMSFDIYKNPFIIRLNQDEDCLEIAIHRKEFIKKLYEQAFLHSKIYLNTKVESLIIEKEIVVGLGTSSNKYYGDLVIDNLGVNSILRNMLPSSFNILNKIEKNQIMYTYRAIYNINKSIPTPIDPNKCYLKHIVDISWVNVEKDFVDVLIGKIGGLTKEEITTTFNKLKSENPIIGENLLSGGGIYLIPVRYPQTKLFGNGYVMIGDSAFTTVPLLGSGIYASIVCSNILVNCLNELSTTALYKYQKEVFSKVCFNFFELDLIKKFLLQKDINKLTKLLKNGVVCESDITTIYNAQHLKYSFKQLLSKGLKGIFHPLLLLSLLKLLSDIKKVRKVLNKIPKTYDNEKLIKWQLKIEKLMR